MAFPLVPPLQYSGVYLQTARNSSRHFTQCSAASLTFSSALKSKNIRMVVRHKSSRRRLVLQTMLPASRSNVAQ